MRSCRAMWGSQTPTIPFASEAGTNTFSWFETGSDSLSGSMSAASDSYFVNTDADANWSIDQFVNDEPSFHIRGRTVQRKLLRTSLRYRVG